MARTYASPTRYRKRQVIATASMKPLMCIMIVFTVMFAIFFPTSGDTAFIFSSLMGTTYTQGNALTNWQVARDTTNANDASYSSQLHANSEWVVTGSGTDHFDAYLTYYNCIAYHTPEMLKKIYEVYPEYQGAGDWLLSSGVDFRLLAAGVIGASMAESWNYKRGLDIMEGGWPGDRIYTLWDSYTIEEQCNALVDANWWYSACGKTTNKPDGWGYGLFQWTFTDSRGVIAEWCRRTQTKPGDPVAQAYVTLFECMLTDVGKYGDNWQLRWKTVVNDITSNNCEWNLDSARLATCAVTRHRVNGNYRDDLFKLNPDGTVSVTDKSGNVKKTSSTSVFPGDAGRGVWRWNSLNGSYWHGSANTQVHINNGYPDTLTMWEVLQAFDLEAIAGVTALK